MGPVARVFDIPQSLSQNSSFVQMFLFLQQALLILALACLTSAYLIDDTDLSVLQYSSNPGAGPVWGPFPTAAGASLELLLPNGTFMTINSAPCYNGTL
jgi:hypothetical protein